jgi:hypothetical protein
MRSSTVIGPILGLSFCTAFADIPVSIPAAADISTTYSTGVDATSANALKIKTLCGATYYAGVASSASLTETSQGELSLKYSLVYSASDGNGKYGTSTGILLPLTPAWSIEDLSMTSAIEFEIKAATAGVTTHLLIGSNLYPTDVAAENASLVSPASDPLTTTYTKVTIPMTALVMPTWMISADGAGVGWLADGTTYTIGIAKAVKNLNIQPILDAAWGGTPAGTAFKTTAAAQVAINNTITIRNVVLKGMECYCPVLVNSCTGTYTLVDDFAATNPSTGAVRAEADPNYLGGYWYAFTDASTDPAKLNDLATGKSKIILPAGVAKWNPMVGSAAIATAQLEKNDTGSAVLYHPYAGWADIGTDLPGTNPDGSMNAPSLKAFSFDLYAGASLESVVPGATFDNTRIRRILFKVGRAGVSDDSGFQVSIPVSQAVGSPICVDVSNLKQPGWDSLPVAWSSLDLTKLSWEILIEDQADSTIHSTSIPSTFGITNVKLWGVDPTGIRATRGAASTALRASYSKALNLTYRVDGPSARIEVRSLGGARVASFQEAANAQNLSLPVALSRGTYVVTVQGANARQVAILSVAR